MRPAVLGGSPPAPGIFRAYTSSDGVVELHASHAAGSAQSIHQILADGNVDIEGALRKRFVAALGAHRERFKFLAAHFFPRRAPQRREIVLAASRDDSRHGIKRHAEHAFDARHRFLFRSAFAKFHQQPVAGPQNALDRQTLERPLQRHVQLAQKKAAISALEPQLVVVHDDDEFRLFHRFSRGRLVLASIPAARSDCSTPCALETVGRPQTSASALSTVIWRFVTSEAICPPRGCERSKHFRLPSHTDFSVQPDNFSFATQLKHSAV